MRDKPLEGRLRLNWREGEELFEFICQQANYAPELMDELLAEAHVESAWVSNLDGATFSQADSNRRVLDLVADRPALKAVF